MKWNIEWIDLQNIERMIAECWRMNERQLEHYYRTLSNQQELVFAGTLGTAFLELMHGIMTGEAEYDWSKLQKDVHMLQKLIQDGLDRDEDYWNEQYLEIIDEPSFYFYTGLGRAFTDQLAVKLELNITSEQKLLQKDIQMIEKVCAVCDFKKESDVQKALSILTKKDKNYFSSWLGESFINTLQEQFVKKEEPVELPAEPEPEPELKPKIHWSFGISKENKKKAHTGKRILMFFMCVPIVCVSIWLYTQVKNNQLHSYLQQLQSTIKAITAGQAAEPEHISIADRKSRTGSEHTPDYAVEVELPEKDDKQIKETMDDTEKHIVDADTEIEIETESGQQESAIIPDLLPQYQSFYNEYPDLFGWLKIPGTEIDVPVMQSDDEEKGEKYYYLHRDHTGKESAEGSLFVDSKSSCYPQDQNTVIYGHNMSNGRIFGTLDRFTDFDFFKEHQNIQYDTIYETGTYQIVAILKTRILYQEEEGFRYYRFFHYDSKSEFQECMDFIKNTQLFDTGEELQYGDQLLMLSTCEYSQENGRLVVVAKRVNQESSAKH